MMLFSFKSFINDVSYCDETLPIFIELMKAIFNLLFLSLESEDDSDSPTYLVESIIYGLRNEVEEKESLFVILKNSYLVEKDPFTGQVSNPIHVFLVIKLFTGNPGSPMTRHLRNTST